MKTLFCQQAAEYTYEKFRENVSTAHIMIMVPGQFAEKKYASIESLGLAFCVSGRTRHLSMKESIAVIFPLSITCTEVLPEFLVFLIWQFLLKNASI